MALETRRRSCFSFDQRLRKNDHPAFAPPPFPQRQKTSEENTMIPHRGPTAAHTKENTSEKRRMTKAARKHTLKLYRTWMQNFEERWPSAECDPHQETNSQTCLFDKKAKRIVTKTMGTKSNPTTFHPDHHRSNCSKRADGRWN